MPNDSYDEYLAPDASASGQARREYEDAQEANQGIRRSRAKDSVELKAANDRVSELETQVDDAKKKLACA